jgi:hypothetical protein
MVIEEGEEVLLDWDFDALIGYVDRPTYLKVVLNTYLPDLHIEHMRVCGVEIW